MSTSAMAVFLGPSRNAITARAGVVRTIRNITRPVNVELAKSTKPAA